MVREQLQICCFHNCDDCRKQCQSHHNANAQLCRKRHLKIPECSNRHNSQDNVRHCCICAKPIVEVIKNTRAPTCAFDGRVPQLCCRSALEEYDENGDHGEHNLKDDHGVQEPRAKWVWVQQVDNQDRYRYIR